MHELTDTDDTTCPVEILEVTVPTGDPDFDPESRGDRSMPYERRSYDKNTGQSPNNPRRQVRAIEHGAVAQQPPKTGTQTGT